jgi:hypothetical protein
VTLQLETKLRRKRVAKELPETLRDVLGSSIAYKVTLARLCNSINAGLMLSQALYWSTITEDPKGWFYKTSAGWLREIHLTLRQQETARGILRTFSFWHEKRKGTNGPMNFRVDIEGLVEVLRHIQPMCKTTSDKPANPVTTKRAFINSTIAKSGFDASAKPYKEAEITSEITKKTTDRILPTPLKFDEAQITGHSDLTENQNLLTKIKPQIKMQLSNVPIHSRGFSSNDYDLYFRDAAFYAISHDIIFVDALDLAVCAMGLQKYRGRLKTIGREVFGREVDFQITTRSAPRDFDATAVSLYTSNGEEVSG